MSLPFALMALVHPQSGPWAPLGGGGSRTFWGSHPPRGAVSEGLAPRPPSGGLPGWASSILGAVTLVAVPFKLEATTPCPAGGRGDCHWRILARCCALPTHKRAVLCFSKHKTLANVLRAWSAGTPSGGHWEAGRRAATFERWVFPREFLASFGSCSSPQKLPNVPA